MNNIESPKKGKISEKFTNWWRKNVVGERGSGYVDDYSKKSTTGKTSTDESELVIPDIPDQIPAGTPPLEAAGTIFQGMVTGVVTEVAKSVLQKIIKQEEKNQQDNSKAKL